VTPELRNAQQLRNYFALMIVLFFSENSAVLPRGSLTNGSKKTTQRIAYNSLCDLIVGAFFLHELASCFRKRD
jgi:hypothetical protein